MTNREICLYCGIKREELNSVVVILVQKTPNEVITSTGYSENTEQESWSFPLYHEFISCGSCFESHGRNFILDKMPDECAVQKV